MKPAPSLWDRPLQVCMSTVGVVGDVCRNMEEDVTPYCDEIMATMVRRCAGSWGEGSVGWARLI